ncbi:hypothetical protein PP707_07230, partial [Acetobacter pasteurianus]|nr:hypothetical protein [Acetobacter pasteurianus]
MVVDQTDRRTDKQTDKKKILQGIVVKLIQVVDTSTVFCTFFIISSRVGKNNHNYNIKCGYRLYRLGICNLVLHLTGSSRQDNPATYCYCNTLCSLQYFVYSPPSSFFPIFSTNT